MVGVVARFRRLYGASPLHLLAFLASMLITAAAVAAWFTTTAPFTVRILVWLFGAIIAHDLLLLPLYSLLDRIAYGTVHGRDATRFCARAPGWVYVRVPAMLSGLLFLVFFAEILRLGDQTYHTASGFHQDVYLSRYLFTCGALFALSGLAYAVTLARERRGRVRERSASGARRHEG